MWIKNKTGIQITSQRITKLEKELIKYILTLPKSSIGLDLGGGNGYISLILSLLQKKIYFYDLKINWKLKIIKKILNLKLNLDKKNLKKISYQDLPDKIDFIYSARFLHYLTYQEAEKLLKIIHKKSNPKAKIFLTVSGLYSDIGQKYPCKNQDIKNRHCFLENDFQKRFEIYEKITLYSSKELIQLIEKFFIIEDIWESDFKNIFIIGTKK